MKVKGLNRRIMIRGVWYTISQTDINTDTTEDNRTWGDCSHDDKIIRLDIDLPEAQHIPVLAHEISHAILREAGVDILIDSIIAKIGTGLSKEEQAELSLDIEEAICDAMEVGHKAFKNI